MDTVVSLLYEKLASAREATLEEFFLILWLLHVYVSQLWSLNARVKC